MEAVLLNINYSKLMFKKVVANSYISKVMVHSEMSLFLKTNKQTWE